MEIKKISSAHNPELKKWRKLHTSKGRAQMQSLLIEGEHLIHEAIGCGIPFHTIILRQGYPWKERIPNLLSLAPAYELEDSLFSRLTETVSPQGVAAIVAVPQQAHDLLQVTDETVTFLLLDAVQDPGNVGTIIRTAESLGASGLFLGKGTADPFQPKAVRSSMGAVFRLPMLTVDLMEVFPVLQQQQVTLVGTSPVAECFSHHYVFPKRVAILLGNEGRGVDPTLSSHMDVSLQIAMVGSSESLNVSITSAILLYERMRQHT